VKSQTIPTPQKVVRPKTFTLKLKTEKKLTYGYLSGINDSLLQLSTRRVTFSNHLVENSDYKTYTYAEVEKVNIRTHGSVGRGIVFGALIGGVFGAIIGLATYEKPVPNGFLTLDFGPGFSALIGAASGVITGGIIGGIIKSKSTKFFIHRNKTNFEKMRTTILEMALSKNGYTAKDSSVNNYVPSSIH
jgi:hypothetical protein